MYKIEDFKKGQVVAHKSKENLKMVVIEIDSGWGSITCRWIKDNKECAVNDFNPYELVIKY